MQISHAVRRGRMEARLSAARGRTSRDGVWRGAVSRCGKFVSVLGAASAPIPSLFQATLALTPNGAARLARCPFPRRFETGRGWWPFTGIQCPYETKTARYTGMEGGQKKNSYSLSAYWAVISEFGGGGFPDITSAVRNTGIPSAASPHRSTVALLVESYRLAA